VRAPALDVHPIVAGGALVHVIPFAPVAADGALGMELVAGPGELERRVLGNFFERELGPAAGAAAGKRGIPAAHFR
jgi:hypothetical protein